MFTKLILLVATITLLSTITTHDLCAETTVQLGANKDGPVGSFHLLGLSGRLSLTVR